MASPQASSAETFNAKWEDLDRQDVYERMKTEAGQIHRKNFVVQLGATAAQVAFDLTKEDFAVLLSEGDRKSYPIRWINIWIPGQQEEAIDYIGNHYGFSRRLQAIFKQHDKSATNPRAQTQTHRFRKSTENDPEKGQARSIEQTPPKSLAQQSREDDFLIYHAVKEKINYSSVDQDPNFVCVGAHWLHQKPTKSDPPSDTERLKRALALHHPGQRERKEEGFLPPKHWSWLALCHDNTVLTIHEAPDFWKETRGKRTQAGAGQPVLVGKDLTERQQQELDNSRQNMLNALLQFSKFGVKDFSYSVISQKEIRHNLPSGSSPAGGELDPTFDHDEVTSNLFYYLFEDYIAIGPILRDSTKRLEKLTTKVLASANDKNKDKDDLVRDLHSFGKDLRQLKHLFESYQNIVKKIISTSNSSLEALMPTTVGGTRPSSGTTASNSRHGRVTLTNSALNRFERLDDRLQLLLLNTIQEYLDDISALNRTYFNLTQQKDSEATARLTRSATLLAKLSVFFLPISFQTSYFSIEVPDLVENYTARTYWYSFAVIATLSFASLFFFGRVLMFFSDRMDAWGTAFHKSFSRCVEKILTSIFSFFRRLFRRSSRSDEIKAKEVDGD